MEPLDLSRLHRTRSLITSGDPFDILYTSLEELGVELSNRCLSIGRSQKLGQKMSISVDSGTLISKAINYAAKRFSEVLLRLQEIRWKKQVLEYDVKKPLKPGPADEEMMAWFNFMGLSINGFLSDVSSLMDALAPVVIQVVPSLSLSGRRRLPGWASIQKSTGNRKYRPYLPSDLTAIIDSTDRWWPDTKEIRDILIHREYDRLVFPPSEEGLLFQIYDQTMKPAILLPEVMYQQGHNVVNFDLYAAYILAEIILLFDELGRVIGSKVGLNADVVLQMYQRGISKSVAASIESLIKVIEKS